MPTYRIPVTIVNSGYCEEEADTKEDAMEIVENGLYEDIYGESLVSVDIDESKAITMISDLGEEFELDDDDLKLLKEDGFEDEDDLDFDDENEEE